MGKCSITVNQIRFIIKPEITHCYVAMDAVGDCPLGLQGWHKRSFPASTSCPDILEGIRTGAIEAPELWGQEAPPER